MYAYLYRDLFEALSNKKKVANKLVNIIRLYKDWRKKAVNTWDWGLVEKDHKQKYLKDGKKLELTIKTFLFKKMPLVLYIWWFIWWLSNYLFGRISGI